MNTSKYRLIQWVEMSNGGIWVTISFIIALFSIFLIQDGSMSIGVFLLAIWFIVICFEAGRYWFGQYRLLKDVLSYTPPKRLSAKVGAALGWGILGMGIIKAIVLIGLIGAIGYLLIVYIDFALSALINPWIMVLTATLVLYAIFRPWLKHYLARITKPILDWFVGAYPTYSIDAKGLTLHLGQGFPKEKQQIPFLFSELDDIKIFSRFESMAFMKYVIGPDLELGARAAADKIAYLTGKMPRPQFFDYLSNATGAKTLFLSGPSLTYFVGLSKQNGEDLIAAFQKNKS